MMARLTALIATLALGLSACATVNPAPGEPAMWVVEDEDSTIYLFGTVHYLQPETVWLTPRILRAMDEADELWIEVIEPEEEDEINAFLGPFIGRYGFSRDRRLSEELTPEEWDALTGETSGGNLEWEMAGMMDNMQPWLPAILLQSNLLMASGYDPELGADYVLRALARSQGDIVYGLAELEEHYLYLAGQPYEVQLQMLRDVLEEGDDLSQALDTERDWAAGNLRVLERDVRDTRREAPELYESLLAERNEKWAARIEEILAGSGVSFIAAGAGHFAGPDSVQARLEARGLRVERR